MAEDYDVIVIGVGAMGSAACYQLASRGVRVLGIDRFDVPNAMGSSHGLSRMIRSAYYEHPDYVPLLRRAWELWHELERESGWKLLHVTGGLYMGRVDDELIFGSMAAAQEHALEHRLLSREELARDFPMFNVPWDFVGMLEERAGLLEPEKCVAAYARLARSKGATIATNEQVMVVSAERDGVTVVTDKGGYSARQVVYTAGPWTSKLFPALPVKLVVTRQTLGWVKPRDAGKFELGRFPVWAIGHEDGSLHYGFPVLPDGMGLKIGHHKPGEATDPDSVNREVSAEDERLIREAVREFIPEAEGEIAAMRICLYTNSSDHHFVIDRFPDERRVTVACGFSGHGFKFASVVGEIVADLVTNGKTELPVDFISLKRFA